MKKIGFTLAELLVAMAIIGVVAAVTLANIHRITPDKDKGMVLKAYKTIMDINKEILEDPSLYLIGTNINGTSTPCTHILACTQRPSDTTAYDATYTGMNKYPKLLQDYMSIAQRFDPTNPYRFITSDGMDYSLAVQEPNTNNLHYILTLDTRNTARQNCTYNSTTCRNPRLFTFEIDHDGFISPTDPLSRAYLMNPSELNDREADLQQADQF